jgi:DNA-binding NtrC family response regulator
MPTDHDPVTAVLLMNRSDKDVKLLRSVLRKVGFRVANFENGNEVLDSLAAGGSSLRLVVVDPATPNLQFQPFLEKLHQAGPDIGVLCLSEDGTEAATLASVCPEHIGGCLTRPFRRAHLLASILDATEKPLVSAA